MLAALVMILAYCFLWFNAEKIMSACCGFVLSVLFSVQGRLQSGWQWRGQLSGYTGVFFSCRDEGRGLICDSTLPFSPFSVYIFFGFYLCFCTVICSVSGFCFWLDSSVLDSVFFWIHSSFLVCLLSLL